MKPTDREEEIKASFGVFSEDENISAASLLAAMQKLDEDFTEEQVHLFQVVTLNLL